MTPTLVRQHLPRAGAVPRVDPRARARDWSEIQERMLVPLYEAVYARLDVGPATRLLGLGCGSGLALLMAVSRGRTPCSPESGRKAPCASADLARTGARRPLTRGAYVSLRTTLR